MLPTHEKQEHNNDRWGKGLGMKYSNSRPVELNAIINESLIWVGKGGQSPSSLGMQVTNPWERFLILIGATVTMPRKRFLVLRLQWEPINSVSLWDQECQYGSTSSPQIHELYSF